MTPTAALSTPSPTVHLGIPPNDMERWIISEEGVVSAYGCEGFWIAPTRYAWETQPHPSAVGEGDVLGWSEDEQAAVEWHRDYMAENYGVTA